MENNFFQILWTTITQRFSKFIFRLRNLTSISRLKNLVRGQIGRFFSRLFDVRPKDKEDYYTVFGYMISKRLAYMLVIVIGVICSVFIVRANSNFFDGFFKTNEVRTYNYNSMLLRMTKGNVRIKAKEGYIAYEGDVEKGYVKGNGTLYDKYGAIVYQGAFEKSKYEGVGTQYYSNGNIMYTGDFSQNLFNGVGKQYRNNGSILYDGEFVNGKKEGGGQLFDNGGNPVYEGRFSKDNILYSELLNKKASDVSTAYTGEMGLYSDEDFFAVHLKDINALYAGFENTDALEDEVMVETVYVLESEFPGKDKMLALPSELTEYFGEPIFEGSSYITESEALVIHLVRENTMDRYYSDPALELEYVYDDYQNITGYNIDKQVYLYTYEKDGMEYTFVCADKDAAFGFYYISEGGYVDERTDSEIE